MKALLMERAKALRPELIGDNVFGPVYFMDVKNDRFVHFTPRARAKEIIQSGKLLMRPPYKKFGIDAVTAVSLVWGAFVPAVQTTHSGDRDLVAVVFRTNAIPKIGYTEEVVWERDVPLKKPRVVEAKRAITMLRRASSLKQEANVYYDRATAQTMTQ
jgi:hypothetical protein